MKGLIETFGEEIEKKLDNTHFVDHVGEDFYINGVDEDGEAHTGMETIPQAMKHMETFW